MLTAVTISRTQIPDFALPSAAHTLGSHSSCRRTSMNLLERERNAFLLTAADTCRWGVYTVLWSCWELCIPFTLQQTDSETELAVQVVYWGPSCEGRWAGGDSPHRHPEMLKLRPGAWTGALLEKGHSGPAPHWAVTVKRLLAVHVLAGDSFLKEDLRVPCLAPTGPPQSQDFPKLLGPAVSVSLSKYEDSTEQHSWPHQRGPHTQKLPHTGAHLCSLLPALGSLSNSGRTLKRDAQASQALPHSLPTVPLVLADPTPGDADHRTTALKPATACMSPRGHGPGKVSFPPPPGPELRGCGWGLCRRLAEGLSRRP